MEAEFTSEWISSHGNVDETLLFIEIDIEHAGLAMKQALTCKTIYSDGFFEVDRLHCRNALVDHGTISLFI